MSLKDFNEQIILTEPDLEVTVTTNRRKRQFKTRPFTAVGRIYNQKGKVMGYPLISTLLTLSKGEQWLYNLIHEKLDYTNNIAFLQVDSLTKSDRPKMSKAFKLLHAKGLIKRVKREMYIVNPDAVINFDNYDEIKRKWDACS